MNEGNCIIGLGHDNKFWGFDATMNAGGCSTVGLRTKDFPVRDGKFALTNVPASTP